MEFEKVSKDYSLPYIAKGRMRLKILWFMIILSIGVAIGLLIYERLNPGSKSSIGGIIYPIAILIFVYFYANSCKIVIKEDELIYNYLFGSKKLSIPKITKMEVKIERRRGLRKGGISLDFYDIGKFSLNPLRINMTPFKKKDLIKIAKIIFKKNPSIETDELAHQLKEGNFDAILKEIRRMMIRSF